MDAVMRLFRYHVVVALEAVVPKCASERMHPGVDG